ncbi:MAG: SDR family NAD(P)-dependent oxidoreductase [Opitutae bacterium]|nr:SDR family NAD(P)-dependent oxidoreductase [Opitutae bacterium]
MELKDKKVLVTGAGGFIGSHLTEMLLQRGCRVRALVRYNSKNSWGWLDDPARRADPNLEVVAGDIRDASGVMETMKGCDVVFHLAALIGIPFSYHSPDTYVDTNIRGTLNVLQAARQLNAERVVITSTSEVYGTAQYVPIDETHPFQGQSPYSATKIGADRLAESFHRSFNVPVIIARPFNTYGPRQSARAIIPTLITQLLAGRKRIQVGSLEPTRDFNFVLDTAAGFIALASADRAVGQEVNIATGEEYSIRQVAEMLIQEIDPEAALIGDEVRVRPAASEVMRLCGANAKIASLTGWRPTHTLRQGLLATVEWFRNPENRAGYKSDIYNI